MVDLESNDRRSRSIHHDYDPKKGTDLEQRQTRVRVKCMQGLAVGPRGKTVQAVHSHLRSRVVARQAQGRCKVDSGLPQGRCIIVLGSL